MGKNFHPDVMTEPTPVPSARLRPHPPGILLQIRSSILCSKESGGDPACRRRADIPPAVLLFILLLNLTGHGNEPDGNQAFLFRFSFPFRDEDEVL